MKKIKTMRIASILLIAVLMTTCAISGTFAKYVTSDTGSDSARVAKWGVQVEIASDLNLFNETYAVHETELDNDQIVNSVAVDTTGGNLVAPGTDNSITFTITGAPEVAVRITIDMEVTSDVVIPAGTDIKQGNPNDIDETSNELAEDYTPVVFTLYNAKGTFAQSGTLEEIAEAFNEFSAEYAPNTNLDDTFTLSWEWAFDGNDAADTYLGNVAAGTVTDANTSTAIAFDFSITVEQID